MAAWRWFDCGLCGLQDHVPVLYPAIKATGEPPCAVAGKRWNILRGEMSWVGPRPALHNQHDLIALRTEADVHTLRPGLTGWAQINGRDELPIAQKVALDAWYLQHQSFWCDARILCLTALRVLRRDGIAH